MAAGLDKILIVRAARKNFACDAATQFAARDRNDVAVAALTGSHRLRWAQAHGFDNQFLALFLSRLPSCGNPTAAAEHPPA